MKVQWFRIYPPVRVQAVQLTEEADWKAIAEWCEGEFRNDHSREPSEVCIVVPFCDRLAYQGDWVIRGCTGNFFTRSADEFTTTYQVDGDQS